MELGFFKWLDNLWVGHRTAFILFCVLTAYVIGKAIGGLL